MKNSIFDSIDLKKSYPALTDRQAQVYHLHKKEINPDTEKTYTHKEIAKKLNIKWRTSQTLYYRACKELDAMETTLESAKGESGEK